jgi:protoporphyrinogen oxidase
MAGLTAARTLAERGVKVTVLEAKERVGGRVFSQRVDGGGTIELGAEFVHGRASEMWVLIDEAGVKTVERDGSMLREAWDGGLAEDDPQDGAMFAPLEALEDFAGEDVAFADWLASSDVPEDERAALTGYVEGFNAADARRIGVRSLGAQQKAEDSSEGGRSYHVVGGYAQLAEHLAACVAA